MGDRGGSSPFIRTMWAVRPFFSFCWSQNFIYGRLPTLAPLRTSAYGDPRRNLIYWQIACAIIAFLICCSSSHFVPFGRLWEPYLVRFLSFCKAQNFTYGRLPTLVPLRTSACGDPIKPHFKRVSMGTPLRW